jgi:predicted acetyltransferase
MKEEKNPITIRMAEISDAEALLGIYAPYVEKTAVTFEYEVPTIEEFRGRIEKIKRRYPYLAAVENGTVVGYSYAKPFGERAAYERAAETVLYVSENHRGKGIGTLLYGRLEEILRRQNIVNLYASVAVTERKDDMYLTKASPAFHAVCGYREIGYFTKCGYKFGNWYDMVWMEKFIGYHNPTPKAFLPVTEIAEKI